MSSKTPQKVKIPLRKLKRTFSPGSQWSVTSIPDSNGKFTYMVDGPFRNSGDFSAYMIDLSHRSDGKLIPIHVKMVSGYSGSTGAVIVPNAPMYRPLTNVMFVDKKNDSMILWAIILILVIMYVR